MYLTETYAETDRTKISIYEFAFIICGKGKAGHCLQAVGAGHHQRTRAPLRLGGAGGGPRPKATRGQTHVVQVNQLMPEGDPESAPIYFDFPESCFFRQELKMQNETKSALNTKQFKVRKKQLITQTVTNKTMHFTYLATGPVCLCSTLPSPGVGEGLSPAASPRSSLSSLWLRSDEKLRLEGVARCSVLL